MSLSPLLPPPPLPPPVPPPAASRSGRRSRHVAWLAADVTLAVVELLLYAGVLSTTSTMSLFLGFFSDGCTSDAPCLGDEFGWGFALAAMGTWVPFLIAIVLVTVLGLLRRQMWWIPLVAFVMSAGIFVLGVALALDGAAPR